VAEAFENLHHADARARKQRVHKTRDEKSYSHSIATHIVYAAKRSVIKKVDGSVEKVSASSGISMKSSKIIARKILSGVLCGCIGFSASAVLAQDSEKLAAANNGFAFDLLKQIAKEQPRENIFISPFSVSAALQMVGNGAAGETKKEMQRVLKTDGLESSELNEAIKRLNQSFNSQSDVTLNLANGIWFQKEFHLKQGFVSHSKYFFGVEPAGIDFSSPKSARIINDWAVEKTRGKIKDLVQFPFPPLTRLVLANAIYFKGKWAKPFEKSETKPRPFYLTSGEMKQTPMMRQSRKFSYQEAEGFQAVRLAYLGERYQMYVFLPTTNSTLQKLLADFDGQSWTNSILPRFSNRKGALVLPKFKVQYEVKLNEALEHLGMKRAFDRDTADFSAMADAAISVDEVKQKSFVEINEEGTEAAAVTGTRITALAIERSSLEPFEMVVDHPFLFVIADVQTHSILFMGTIFDPTD
jgi:serpin B